MSTNIAIANKCKVSICIITYNHELYIRQCLESILSQKCNFLYEIIVRDDCSKDNTLNIIKSYKDKFPKIIKILNGILNIGSARNTLTVLGAAQGQYLAICEGDDYWLDDSKLQKQVDVMDIDPSITFTAHPCRLHDKNGLQKTASYVKSSEIIAINCNDVLRVAGQYAPTASYMIRKECLAALPVWFKDTPVGDFFIEMYALSMGSGRYLPDPMSAYRTHSMNSWSNANTGNNGPARLANAIKMLYYIGKMQESEFFEENDFTPKIAAVYFNIAIAHLLMDNHEGFQEAIIKSKLTQTKPPIKHKLFYYTRALPSILNIIYRLKLRLNS